MTFLLLWFVRFVLWFVILMGVRCALAGDLRLMLLAAGLAGILEAFGALKRGKQ